MDPSRPAGLPDKILSGLSRISIALKADAWSRTSEKGLNPTQAHILAALRGSAIPPTLSDVAERLGSTKATVSDSIASLEGKGLIRKRPSPEDARRLELTLTAAGRKLAAKLGGWPDELRAGLDSLDAEEQAQLLRLLSKAILGLQEQGRISPSRMCVSCRYFQPDRHAGSAKPHHCGFVDAPFADAELRLDCADHLAKA